MATQIQFRRGTTAQTNAFTGANGEVTVDTTKKVVVVHDGVTAGGTPMLAGAAIAGKMDKSVYDPGNINGNAFDRSIQTGVQPISSVTGLAAALGVYAAKSANYTAVLADNNAEHRFTAAATIALTAAATLGASWHYTVTAAGGDLTVDPNGSETINGNLTLVVPNGTTAKIICDGSAFFTVFRTNPWELIIDAAVPGGSANVSFTNLSAFRKLRITGKLNHSASSQLKIQTSTNNGVSYDSGASDYAFQLSISSAGTTSPVGGSASTSMFLAPAVIDPGGSACFSVIYEAFNKAEIGHIEGTCSLNSSGLLCMGIVAGQRNAATAKNAFLISPSSGTITGTVTVEGIRG